MKRLFFTAAFALFALSSCKKQSYCWKCILFPPNAARDGVNINAPQTSDVCNKTQAEIDQYQKDNTITITTTSGGSSQQTNIQSVQCTKE